MYDPASWLLSLSLANQCNCRSIFQNRSWCPFNMFRTSNDIHPHWGSIMNNLHSTQRFLNVSRPGCWGARSQTHAFLPFIVLHGPASTLQYCVRNRLPRHARMWKPERAIGRSRVAHSFWCAGHVIAYHSRGAFVAMIVLDAIRSLAEYLIWVRNCTATCWQVLGASSARL